MPVLSDRARGRTGGSARGGSRDDAAARLPHRRPARRLARAGGAAAAPRDARRDARAPARAAARAARALRADPRRPRARRPPVRQPRRSPRLLRLRTVRRHVAGRARRPDRERLQPLRRLLDGVGRPEPGRARGARLVQAVDRLPGGRGRQPRERRLGREHDCARVRARSTRGPDARRPGALRLGSGDRRAPVPVVEIALLRSLPLFAPLGAPELEGLAHGLAETRVPAGTAVVREGEPGDRFYVVAEGGLDVHCAGRELRRLERGDGFGEIALLREVPRTATVTARTDARLYALGKASFLASVGSHPRATSEAERLVHERLPAPQATIAP